MNVEVVQKRHFVSFEQANVLTNVQILCLECQKDKTAASR